MKVKASLHIHTKEDFQDGYVINYNIYGLIDHAKILDFKVLALTGHDKYIYKPEYGEYAKDKGIILMPGIELRLNKFFLFNSHLIILNCGFDSEKIKNFEDLREYKKNHPEILVLAPHPAFDILESMSLSKLIKYMDVFDAIEHSWFYSKLFNLNNRVEKIAAKFNKPFISTADAHIFNYINTDYALIDIENLSTKEVIKAIKAGNFSNITAPKTILQMIKYIILDIKKRIIKYPFKIVNGLFKN